MCAQAVVEVSEKHPSVEIWGIISRNAMNHHLVRVQFLRSGGIGITPATVEQLRVWKDAESRFHESWFPADRESWSVRDEETYAVFANVRVIFCEGGKNEVKIHR